MPVRRVRTAPTGALKVPGASHRTKPGGMSCWWLVGRIQGDSIQRIRMRTQLELPEALNKMIDVQVGRDNSDGDNSDSVIIPTYFWNRRFWSGCPRITGNSGVFISHDSYTYATKSGLSHTVGPRIIESFWVKNRVSTGALGALDDPCVVRTKILKHS